ncbi:MAG: c-type cytochrome domain-containing protein [Pyrinomonadaceae bacterium]
MGDGFFDGKVGKFRDTGLVKWGFYMDHFLDYVFLCSLLIGYSFILPLTSRYHLFFLLAVFTGYMVSSFLSFAATSKFEINFYKFGPTEFRIAIIIINTLLVHYGTEHMEKALPFVAAGALVGLSILVYRTQRKIWQMDMAAKKISYLNTGSYCKLLHARRSSPKPILRTALLIAYPRPPLFCYHSPPGIPFLWQLNAMILKVKLFLCLALLGVLIATDSYARFSFSSQVRKAASSQNRKVARPVATKPCGAFFETSGDQKTLDYATHIRPIFEAACFSCHGGQRALGQLRLDTKALAMKGGISGPAIIVGKGSESRLVHRITGSGDEARMPMGGEPLTSAQIELIKRWIDEGAAWPGDENVATPAGAASPREQLPAHWAYVKPSHPQPPGVADTAWTRNSIDNFVLARLEKESLSLRLRRRRKRSYGASHWTSQACRPRQKK